MLDVPVPVSSPWTFELEVDKTLRLDERNESEIYICKIRNVLTEEGLTDGRSFEERLKEAAPVKRSLRYAGIAFLKVLNVVTSGFLKYYNVYGHKHICTMR